MGSDPLPFTHIPVMYREALEWLQCRPGGVYVDGTLGGAGHARGILERIQPGGSLLGIDQDRDAIRHAESVLAEYGDSVRLFHGNFADLPLFLSEAGINGVDGILLDLGLSFHQIEESGRGFSFRKDEPLDMRMDVRIQVTAGDLVNQESETGLAEIFKTYGEERWARRIARRIVQVRRGAPIRTSRELAELVAGSVPRGDGRIHPATRVFQALRIAVNGELDRLSGFMEKVADLLVPGGRLCVLSFHSLEDRIVKQGLKDLSRGCTCPPIVPRCVCEGKPRMRILTRKPVRPSEEEIDRNPMSRSTKLRAAEKLAE